jgi:hypothetical protein
VVILAVEAALQRGTLVMQPAERSLQSKEVPLETFFHKMSPLGIRPFQFQKSKIGNRQSEIRKILFKNKDDQFRTGAWGSTVGRPNV